MPAKSPAGRCVWFPAMKSGRRQGGRPPGHLRAQHRRQTDQVRPAAAPCASEAAVLAAPSAAGPGEAKAGPQAAFAEVYATKAWGDDGGDFFGPGGFEAAVTAPYLDFLRSEFAAMARPPRCSTSAAAISRCAASCRRSKASPASMSCLSLSPATRGCSVQSACASFAPTSARDPLPEADVVLVRG